MHKDGRGTSGRTPAWCGHRGFIAAALFLLWFGWALPSSAHEQQVWQIGDAYYFVVIGFESEPPLINDRATVELGIGILKKGTAEQTSQMLKQWPDATYVSNLETTLTVEVSAGGQGGVLNLLPIFPPHRVFYRANFFPTDPGPFRLRFLGTIGGTPIDISTSCTPISNHNELVIRNPPRRVSEVISPGVKRVFIGGGFLCPVPRGPLEIPEPSYVTAARRAQEAPPAVAPPKQEPGLIFDLRVLYLGLGGLAALAAIAGLIIGIRLIIRWLRRSSAPPSY